MKSILMLLTLLTTATAGALSSPGTRPAVEKDQLYRINVQPEYRKEDITYKWTVMLYMNGKNNLSINAKGDMNQAEFAGSNSEVRIIAEVGTKHGEGWSVRRYDKVTRNFSPFVTSESTEMGNLDMGSPDTLTDFISWGKTNFPAERNMLVLWNHGSGWKGISTDHDTKNRISLFELSDVFKKTGKVNVLLSDACLMQTLEVLYQLKDYAEVIVGSEEIVPPSGYNYAALNRLRDGPNAPTEAVGESAVRSYERYYSLTFQSTTNSAVRTKAVPLLVKLVNDWAILANTPEIIPQARKASQSATRFESYSVDMLDFMQKTAYLAGNTALLNKTAEIARYLADRKNGPVITNVMTGKTHNAFGIAIYVPYFGQNQYEISYTNLDFARDTEWDEFLRRAFP